jgi:alcohol dehydrogenase (NADP+)
MSTSVDPIDIAHMLQFVSEKDIKPWITKFKMSEVNEAIPAIKAGKAHYRYVLVNEGNGGKL